VTGIVVLAALLLADLVMVAVLVFLVVGSLTGDDADDPHGYVVIFGVVALLVLVPIGLVVLALLRRLARQRPAASPAG
jgi:Kef-type K+ transport system membrane component KefB